MAQFQTVIVESQIGVNQRLADFGLDIESFISIAKAARMWANDASPIMPLNSPGTLAYIYGVQELRQQLLDGDWTIDRTCGIEAVVHRDLNLRIAYQNVDRACDLVFPPIPRSAKGSASENLCGPNLFENAGIEAGPLTGVKSDGIPTYYVMVGEDGSVELSQPVIKSGQYHHFNERILIHKPNDDFDIEVEPEDSPIDNFDVPVTFRSRA